MRQNVSFFFYLMKVVALCGCGCILCVRACVVGASVLSILLYYVQGQYLVGNMVDLRVQKLVFRRFDGMPNNRNAVPDRRSTTRAAKMK